MLWRAWLISCTLYYAFVCLFVCLFVLLTCLRACLIVCLLLMDARLPACMLACYSLLIRFPSAFGSWWVTWYQVTFMFELKRTMISIMDSYSSSPTILNMLHFFNIKTLKKLFYPWTYYYGKSVKTINFVYT